MSVKNNIQMAYIEVEQSYRIHPDNRVEFFGKWTVKEIESVIHKVNAHKLNRLIHP